ncbi:ShlB/FhaC/HecB family hemolysin secretion/activation protein [Martelella alba]|uniref:ShlB/FhaC/HecB family hemolysin secretion/activation protein n=1 Tax=Martelella alba TaxID=2590451 RepID=A0ABY2SGB3_9HYPH|nr:ShlB/FhaC/HecB family hemolysin secretion/activation protein [Martelella alba]TKI04146.1 ShlB/FhaC/HecB family hemolysin secretion/activation protein [Martelella alba]
MNTVLSIGRYCFLWASFVGVIAIPDVRASTADSQQRHWREQQEARERRLTPAMPDVHLSKPRNKGALSFPEETPCRRINHIVLEGADAFPRWLRLDDLLSQARGRCLGVRGIDKLMGALQNRLIDHGWITTRVLAPDQDLREGRLRLLILPGRVAAVQLNGDGAGRAALFNSLPIGPGDVLDLRDIEQGLENLQRLPSSEASVELVPGERPGESIIFINRTQPRRWRLGTWLDDSGTRASGRYHAGIMLALDNPFSLSDLFYVTLGRDTGFAGMKYYKAAGFHYSLPWGYWLFSVNGNRYGYGQNTGRPVNAVYPSHRYQNEVGNLSLQAKRVIHRGAAHKTALSYDIMTHTARIRFNGARLSSPPRQISAWRAGLAHRRHIGRATLDTDVSYQQGTRWFGARPNSLKPVGQCPVLGKATRWSASLNAPFTLGQARFRYQAHYRHQLSHNRLMPSEQFAIGNRWTVRGFDGERTLSADDGWMIRNDIAWRTPVPDQEWYLAVDYGEMHGALGERTTGRRLAGGASGLRGAWSAAGVKYDLFAGAPFSKPDGLRTDAMILGFNLAWQH